MGSADAQQTQLLCAGIVDRDTCSRLVYAKRPLEALYISSYYDLSTLSPPIVRRARGRWRPGDVRLKAC